MLGRAGLPSEALPSAIQKFPLPVFLFEGFLPACLCLCLLTNVCTQRSYGNQGWVKKGGGVVRGGDRRGDEDPRACTQNYQCRSLKFKSGRVPHRNTPASFKHTSKLCHAHTHLHALSLSLTLAHTLSLSLLLALAQMRSSKLISIFKLL